MNRRQFGKTALGVAAATVLTPTAFAAQRRSIKDCVVIDFRQYKKHWRHFAEPDGEGRTFVYEDSSSTASFRHFEFLGSDGLVIGISTRIEHWTRCYDTFEDEFLHFYKQNMGKVFTHSEFLTYVEDVRDYLNGNIVPIDSLA
jgi:hypothetical protein